jgi:hypothetical protein
MYLPSTLVLNTLGMTLLWFGDNDDGDLIQTVLSEFVCWNSE